VTELEHVENYRSAGDVAAVNAESARSKAEQPASRAEHKATFQTRIDNLNTMLKAMLEQAQRMTEQKKEKFYKA
jgi:hypothetical protein